MGAAAKDTEACMRQLRKAGYTTERTGRRHWVVSWQGQFVADASGTPGRYGRNLANLRAAVRRFEREQKLCPAHTRRQESAI